MRIAVITCNAYADALQPFLALFEKFWPGCPYPMSIDAESVPGETWCSVVARVASGDEPILMMMEDFFLTAPVQQDLIEQALSAMSFQVAGRPASAVCVRLYPCPGAMGHEPWGVIPHGAPNRISCQAAIWKPSFLRDVALHSMGTTAEAGDFENLGTPYADTIPGVVWAFNREVKPWPMEYLCSAISRGQWNPDAIRLCDKYGIPLDRSMRQVAAS